MWHRDKEHFLHSKLCGKMQCGWTKNKYTPIWQTFSMIRIHTLATMGRCLSPLPVGSVPWADHHRDVNCWLPRWRTYSSVCAGHRHHFWRAGRLPGRAIRDQLYFATASGHGSLYVSRINNSNVSQLSVSRRRGMRVMYGRLERGFFICCLLFGIRHISLIKCRFSLVHGWDSQG